MSLLPTIRNSTLTAFAITVLGIIASGCLPTCPNVPDAHFASLRVVNAVANTDALLIYVDGKLFDRAYYDLKKNTNFGYKTTFVADGSKLEPGRHHIVVLGNGSATDTLIHEDRRLSDERQTLLYIGRYAGTPAQRPRVLYLRDQLRTAGTTATYARFVNAASDLDTLDNYFSKSPKHSATGALAPDLRFGYGCISDSNRGGAGTGLSPNDYIVIPGIADGLMVTKKGDTSSAGTIITIPYWSPSIQLLATIVIRGESQPIGEEPTVSVIVLEDGEQGYGNYSFDYDSYGVRFVNASRHPLMSLLADGVFDRAKQTFSRNDIPQQSTVLKVPTDSITGYWPLTLNFHGQPIFYTSPTIDRSDIVFKLPPVDPATLGSTLTATANARYTIIATETKPLGFSGNDDSALVLYDTVTVPADPTFGRIRFVNASPDHAIEFTVGGADTILKQGGVAFRDAPFSTPITIVGPSSKITLNPNVWKSGYGYPATVIFLPATATNPYPYSVVYH